MRIDKNKLYDRKQLSVIFDVSDAAISYIVSKKKLIPSPIIGEKQCQLYTQAAVLKFIIQTHLGKNNNSVINTIQAIKLMGLENEVKLPPTKRRLSWVLDREKPPHKPRIAAFGDRYKLNIPPAARSRNMTRQQYIDSLVNTKASLLSRS